MLTFTETQNMFKGTRIEVRIDNKFIGTIRNVPADYSTAGGFRYIPKGQAKPSGIKGEVFPTLAECKNSLEN